jgi:LL-diaminopimelate aminotransferase
MQSIQTQFFAGLGAKISALEAAGKPVIRLDVGSPDMPPQAHILEALWNSARRADTHGYQPHNGSRALLDAWAQMYQRVYGVQIQAEKEVVPLLGSKEGIFHLTQAFIGAGDVVLIPNPGYLTYESATRFAGGEPYFMPLLPENDYLPDFDAVPEEVAQRAKIMWLNYPNNPTAAVAPLDFFRKAVDFGRKYQLLVCHDAAYSQVVFDGTRAVSIFEADVEKEVSVEFNTLSKSHNMAGWRVGAALGNAQAIKMLYTLKTQLDSGHFKPILEAAVAAMMGDQSWLEERNRIYQERRDILVAGLREIGLEPRIPKASLYVWSPVPPGWSSEGFCQSLLEEVQVSFTPGTVFGKYGEGYVRICVCAEAHVIEAAMERLKGWVKQR